MQCKLTTLLITISNRYQRQDIVLDWRMQDLTLLTRPLRIPIPKAWRRVGTQKCPVAFEDVLQGAAVSIVHLRADDGSERGDVKVQGRETPTQGTKPRSPGSTFFQRV